MGFEEILNLILESKSFLEDYRMYGRMVQEAIDALDRVETLVSNPEGGGLKEALSIVATLRQRMEPYKDFVPTLAEKIEGLHSRLKDLAE
ncbi:hypothetical protein KEJ47_06920 [Candidatus Bathyarchaeota archaeon]|nr:hypothetical protein [Candidatus Bathyarchaeota archaeon]